MARDAMPGYFAEVLALPEAKARVEQLAYVVLAANRAGLFSLQREARAEALMRLPFDATSVRDSAARRSRNSSSSRSSLMNVSWRPRLQVKGSRHILSCDASVTSARLTAPP